MCIRDSDLLPLDWEGRSPRGRNGKPTPTPWPPRRTRRRPLTRRRSPSRTFADYTDDELVGIFRKLAADADYDVSDDVEQHLRAMLAQVQRGPTFGNGRYSRNTLEAAIGAHAWRLREVEDPDVHALRTLEPADLSPDGTELDLAHPLVAQDGEQPEHSGTTPEEDEVQPS